MSYMGHINLKDSAYENYQRLEQTDRNLNSLVDEIIYKLVTESAKLVNDVEQGVIPFHILEQEVVDYIDDNHVFLESSSDRSELIKKVKDYLFGYGPLQDLLDRKDILDIRVKDENNTWVKIKGRWIPADVKFASKQSLLTFCYYLCIKNGGNISELNAIQKLDDTESHPDFILRLNICIQPVSRKSPGIHIRKIPRNKPSMEDLMDEGMFDSQIYGYLKTAIECELNILWCGRGGSGKTYCMNACLEKIPRDKAILVMQESEELHSKHPNCEFQRVKYKSGESEIEYTLRDLTINALLRAIDYMIIGEIKGAEAWDLINASYTGHVVWTSLHTSKASDATEKLVHYMKYSGTDLKREELLRMLASIDVIIYMRDFKCFEIIEVAGFDNTENRIIYNPVFQYVIKQNPDGRLEGRFEKVNDSCEKIREKIRYARFKAQNTEEVDLIR